jgi:hypothetical protein
MGNRWHEGRIRADVREVHSSTKYGPAVLRGVDYGWVMMSRAKKTGAARKFACAAMAVLLLAALPRAADLSRPASARAEEGAAGWTILGLDVPAYAERTHLKVAAGERDFIRHHKLEVRWNRVQPNRGAFDWGYYDRHLNAILADGSRSILLLLGGPVPGWAQDRSYGSLADKSPPADLDYWYVFCREVAARYGPVVDFYEIWNEPGWDRDAEAFRLFGTSHFGGQVEKDYLPLLQAGHAAIKEKDASGIVICGALVNTLEDDPQKGTEMYTYLFGETDAHCRDVEVELRADFPVSARRSLRLDYEAERDAGERAGAGDARTRWYFADGCTRPGFTTWLSLENPGGEDAAVTLDYYGVGGAEGSRKIVIEARSRLTLAVNQQGVGVGESDSNAGDVSFAVVSDRPVLAERSIYMRSGDGGGAGQHGGSGRLEAAWWLPGGGHAMREYVCVLNPGPDPAAVTLDYGREDGGRVRDEAVVEGFSRFTFALSRDGAVLGQTYPSGADASITLSSDRPVVAERAFSLSCDGSWAGNSRSQGAGSALTHWRLGGVAGSISDDIYLFNPRTEPVQAGIAFAVRGVRLGAGELLVPPGGGRVVNVDANAGFRASCDMISVHPYKMPGNWGPHFANLSEAMRSIGVDKEIVVTEVGWPHHNDGDPSMFSEQQQADAMGDWGLGPLRDAGCRKIWIYKDMDEPPGRSWDKCYYGMFRHDGSPHPSWQRYKGWQMQNPDYPRLPPSL